MTELDHREIEQKKREENRAKSVRRAERDASDLRWVMNRPEGRRFLWRVMAMTGAMLSPAADTELKTNRLIGRHAVGLEILNAMEKAQPLILGKMQREAASDPLKES